MLNIIGVDLYTFVGARAPTMMSWAPPQGALGGAQLKLVLVSLLRYFDARAGRLRARQGIGRSVTTVLAASLNLDAFTLSL